jgi:dodecin
LPFVLEGRALSRPFVSIASNRRRTTQRSSLQRRFVFILATDKCEPMSEHIYKKIELVGSSPDGIEQAVKNALGRAEKTIRNMRWFEIIETRGEIEEGKVNHWQVTLKVGFTLDK